MSNQTTTPYVAYRVREPMIVDGHLSERAWQLAPRSPRFVDVIGGTPALYDTRAAVLWDDRALYVGYWFEEPYIRADITRRDGIIFSESDGEVFIDGGDTYYEFEINARGTVYEVFYIWKDAYKRGGPYDVPEFDLLSRDAVAFGGNHDRSGTHFWRGSHPRGLRWAFLDWDFPGLQAAVHRDGPLNDTAQAGKGWTVELAFPWEGMKWLANGRSLPPHDGDVWRLLLARYEKLELNGQEVHVGWSWDPVGSDDNHAPDKFTPVCFSARFVDEAGRWARTGDGLG